MSPDFPNTVAESMAMGRKAALAMHRFLHGEDVEKAGPAPPKEFIGKEILPSGLPLQNRQEMPRISSMENVKDFQEVELGFTKEQAMKEAQRCLQCRTCNCCLAETLCVAFFAIENRDKRSPMVRGSLCGGCGRCARSCPYGNIHLTSIVA